MRATLLIADNQPIFAFTLGESLRARYSVLDTLSTLDDLVGRVRATNPEIVILDLAFGKRSALPFIPAVRKAGGQTTVVVLTAFAEPLIADAALESGASAYVLKTRPISEIHQAIEQVCSGKTFVSDLSCGDPADAPMTALNIGMSRKECRILESLRAGRSREAVSAEIGVSVRGVEYHLDRLRHLLGFRRTEQLVAWYARCRLGLKIRK